jgi:hypothetical protein
MRFPSPARVRKLRGIIHSLLTALIFLEQMDLARSTFHAIYERGAGVFREVEVPINNESKIVWWDDCKCLLGFSTRIHASLFDVICLGLFSVLIIQPKRIIFLRSCGRLLYCYTSRFCK